MEGQEEARQEHREAEADFAEKALEAVSGEGAMEEVRAAARLIKGLKKKSEQTTDEDDGPPVAAAEPTPVTAPAEPATEPAAAEVQTVAADDQPSPDEKYKNWEAVKAAEKRNRVLRDQMKAERAKLEQERKDLEAAKMSVQGDKERLVNDPLGVLEERGTAFEDLAKRVLAGGKMSAEEAVKRLSVEMKDRFEAMEKKYSEAEQKQQEKEAALTEREQNQYVAEYMTSVKQALAQEKFSLLNDWAEHPDHEVLALARSYAQERGELLTPDKAAEILQEEVRRQLTRQKSKKSILDFFGAPGNTQDASATAGQGEAPRTPKSPRTLTNKTAAAPAPIDPEENLSDYERIRRAAKLMGPIKHE